MIKVHAEITEVQPVVKDKTFNTVKPILKTPPPTFEAATTGPLKTITLGGDEFKPRRERLIKLNKLNNDTYNGTNYKTEAVLRKEVKVRQYME